MGRLKKYYKYILQYIEAPVKGVAEKRLQDFCLVNSKCYLVTVGSVRISPGFAIGRLLTKLPRGFPRQV